MINSTIIHKPAHTYKSIKVIFGAKHSQRHTHDKTGRIWQVIVVKHTQTHTERGKEGESVQNKAFQTSVLLLHPDLTS